MGKGELELSQLCGGGTDTLSLQGLGSAAHGCICLYVCVYVCSYVVFASTCILLVFVLRILLMATLSWRQICRKLLDWLSVVGGSGYFLPLAYVGTLLCVDFFLLFKIFFYF